MYYVHLRWHFVSDDETWISAFHVKPQGDQSVPDAAEAMLNNHVAKMYGANDPVVIDKIFFEPVEPGLIREWKPKR